MDIVSIVHPDEEMLEQYLIGRLPSAEAAKIEKHLLTCVSCQEIGQETVTFINTIKVAYSRAETLPFQMEPDIQDGSLCAFGKTVTAPYDGKVVLMEQCSEAGGKRYTVKRYHRSTNPDPHRQGEPGWLHERITLESINADYPSWDVASAVKVNVIGEFLFDIWAW